MYSGCVCAAEFKNNNKCLYVPTTDIQGRSQTSYTAPCNGVVNHGAQIGGVRVFAVHTHGNKCKQNASTIFACRGAFYTCLSSRSDRSTYAPDKSQLFWSWENPNTIIWAHAGTKMAQVLGSLLYICGIHRSTVRAFCVKIR